MNLECSGSSYCTESISEIVVSRLDVLLVKTSRSLPRHELLALWGQIEVVGVEMQDHAWILDTDKLDVDMTTGNGFKSYIVEAMDRCVRSLLLVQVTHFLLPSEPTAETKSYPRDLTLSQLQDRMKGTRRTALRGCQFQRKLSASVPVPVGSWTLENRRKCRRQSQTQADPASLRHRPHFSP